LNDSTEGQFDLMINSTQPDDVGVYSCTVGWDPAAQADLIVLGKFLTLDATHSAVLPW